MVLTMKFFANLKKLNKLGASMVEYAIVLACIASLGVSVSDNLTNTLNGVFNKVTGVITGAESDSKKGSLEHFMDNIANEPDFMKLLYSAVNFNSSQDISKWNSNAQVLMGDTEQGLASLLGTDQFTAQLSSSTVPNNPGIKFLTITTAGKYTYNNTPSEKVASTVLVYKTVSKGNYELIGTHQDMLKVQNANQYSENGVRFIFSDIAKQYDSYK